MAALADAGEAGELPEALRAEIERVMRGLFVRIKMRYDFGNAGAPFLAEKLRGNTMVVELTLFQCGIGAVGARALAEALGEQNVTLKKLNLFRNPLGDDGAEAMAHMIKKNATLEQLGLGNCGVGDRGARALGEALKGNNTLKGLHLHSNIIGEDGANALAEALRWNELLEDLRLMGCQRTNAGASSLLAALRESNSALTNLGLFGDGGMEGFKIRDSIRELLDENDAVVPATAERRARCLLFCCLQLASTAHEHVVPSIGAVPVPVMQYAVEHAGTLHVAKRFEHENAVAGHSSTRVHARSSSSSPDFESATARRR